MREQVVRLVFMKLAEWSIGHDILEVSPPAHLEESDGLEMSERES